MSKKCHCCNGAGVEDDNEVVGRSLSGLRLREGITLRALAAEMMISHSYLSQLEHGKRRWNYAIIKRYRTALNALFHRAGNI